MDWRGRSLGAVSGGLIVVDTATYFITAGQGFIVLLIPLGGLGMLAFTSLIITALGRRLSLRAESLFDDARGAAPHIDSGQWTIDIVRVPTAGSKIPTPCWWRAATRHWPKRRKPSSGRRREPRPDSIVISLRATTTERTRPLPV